MIAKFLAITLSLSFKSGLSYNRLWIQAHSAILPAEQAAFRITFHMFMNFCRDSFVELGSVNRTERGEPLLPTRAKENGCGESPRQRPRESASWHNLQLHKSAVLLFERSFRSSAYMEMNGSWWLLAAERLEGDGTGQQMSAKLTGKLASRIRMPESSCALHPFPFKQVTVTFPRVRSFGRV